MFIKMKYRMLQPSPCRVAFFQNAVKISFGSCRLCAVALAIDSILANPILADFLGVSSQKCRKVPRLRSNNSD